MLFLVSGFQAQTPPVNAVTCGSWNLSKPTITAHDAKFTINPPAGGAPGNLSILAIRGMSNTRDIDIPIGATEITVTLPDDWYRAVMVFETCEISNTQNFAIPAASSGTSGSAECDNFRDCTTITGIPGPDPATFGDDTFIVDLVTQILPIAIGIGGFLSVIIVIISGLQFITSNGNPEGAAAARGRLIFALVGFVLLTLAFAITKVIDTLFLRGSGIF